MKPLSSPSCDDRRRGVEDAPRIGEVRSSYLAQRPAPVALIEAGQKPSELGVIPFDWQIRSLREVAQVQSGIAKNSKRLVRNAVDVHYLRVANVQDGYLDLDQMSTIRVSRDELVRYAVLSGDVLMNEGGDLDQLGRGAMWRGEFDPCVHQNHVFVVRCRAGLLPEFLNAWTGSTAARRYFLLAGKQTTNLASINKTALGELPVLMPRPEEQRAIAEALSDVDGLLGALDTLIAKKRAIKQATMQQLLTGKTRLPGFSGNWVTKRLGDVADVKTGPFGSSLHERDYVQDGTPIITVEHLSEFGVEHRNLPLVSDADRSRLRAYCLEVGDIVFSRVGSIDRNAMISPSEAGWLFSGRLLRVRSDKKLVDSAFLSYQFHGEAFRTVVRSAAVGQTMPCLNTQILKNLPVFVPPLGEQSTIAAVLSDMDTEIVALQARREKTRVIKQGMMQQLLTGRVRLVSPSTAMPEAATP